MATTIVIDGDRVTVNGVVVSGQPQTMPATPVVTAPPYVSEIGAVFHPELNVPGPVPWVETPVGGSVRPEIYVVSAGTADLPMPSKANGQHVVIVHAGRGEMYLRVRVPDDAVDGNGGWFKGYSVGSDNFTVSYTLSEVKRYFNDRAPYGDMGIPWHIGPERLDGQASLQHGRDYWLNIDKQFDGDLALQVTRPDAGQH